MIFLPACAFGPLVGPSQALSGSAAPLMLAFASATTAAAEESCAQAERISAGALSSPALPKSACRRVIIGGSPLYIYVVLLEAGCLAAVSASIRAAALPSRDARRRRREAQPAMPTATISAPPLNSDST